MNRESMDIYTYGIYNQTAKLVGWAFGANGKGYSGLVTDHEACSMQNIAGEMAAVMQAISFAIKLRVKTITIHHNYEGISKLVTGEWEGKKPPVQAFVQYMDNVSKKIKIEFVKVKSHCNPAELIARETVGLKI